MKWKSFSVAADAPMERSHTADRAVAKGAPRNDGFVLMPNEVEAYRLGDEAFEYEGSNGFMITLDINSKDLAAAPAAK